VVIITDFDIQDKLPETHFITEEDTDKSALLTLINYNFIGKDELGTSLIRYNGAIRVNVLTESNSRIVRSPSRFLTIVEQIGRESPVPPSYGLKVRTGNRFEYVHLVLEINSVSSVGIFYFDTKRTLLVPQVHYAERMVNSTNLNGAIIVANHIGVPAKKEAERINSMHGGYGILTIEQYDTIERRKRDFDY
jgi:hypothetical protein